MYFPDAGVRIPFKIEGIVSYFPTRCPSREELSRYSGEYLRLTPNGSDWNPHTHVYRDQEESMLNYKGEINDNAMHRHLISKVNVDLEEKYDINKSYTVSGVHSGKEVTISPDNLAKKWRIPIELAKRTAKVTTQLCARSKEPATLNRRFKSNDRMLRYNRVATDVFMDTFFSAKKIGPSTRGHKCCQIFCTEFGHVFVVMLESKSGKDIAYALKKYFKTVGVPPMIICDAATDTRCSPDALQ